MVVLNVFFKLLLWQTPKAMVEGQLHNEKQDFEYHRYDTKLHLMDKFKSFSLRNVEYSFIAIVCRSVLAQSGTPCGPGGIVQSFTKDYYFY